MRDDKYDGLRYGEYDRTGMNAPLIRAGIYIELGGYKVVIDTGDNEDTCNVSGSADDILNALKVVMVQQKVAR